MAINRKEVFRNDTFDQQRVKINEVAQDLFDISTGVTPIDRLLVDQAIVPAAIEDSEGSTGEEGQILKKTRDGKIIWKSLSIENVLWVSKDGDDTNDGLSQLTAKSSIGAALRAAQRGFNGKLCDAANNILLNKKLIQDEVVGTLLSENKDYARGNRWIDAYDTIQNNIDYIANEGFERGIARYLVINPAFTVPGGNQECIDDVKLFIDAVAFNVKYDGNNKVYDYAEVYTISEFGDLIDGERDASAIIYQEVAYVMMEVMRQDATAVIEGVHGLTPVFDNAIVLDPLAIVDQTSAEAADLIRRNKNFIAAEGYDRMIANPAFAGFVGTGTPQDCIDDVLDVLDAIIYNLTYGGNDKVYDAANVYVTGTFNGEAVSTLLDAERDEAVNVYENARDVAIDVMRGIAVTPISGTENTFTQVIDPYVLPDPGDPDCVAQATKIADLTTIITDAIGTDAGVGDLTGVPRTEPTPAVDYGAGCTDVASAIWALTLIYLQAIGSDATPGNLDGITRTSNNRFVFPDSPAESGRYKDARNLIYANMEEIKDRALAEVALEYPDFFFPDDDQTNRFSRYKDSYRLIQQNRREIIDRSLAEIALDYDEAADFSYPGDPVEHPRSRYRDGYRLIQKNRTTIIEVSYREMVVEAGVRGLTLPAGNEVKCKRDIGFFLDAVCLDLFLGGNTYTVEFLNQYYDGGVFKLNGLSAEEEASRIAFENVRDLATDGALTNNLTNLTGEVTLSSSGVLIQLDPEAQTYTGVNWYRDLTVLEGNPNYDPGNDGGDVANTDPAACFDVQSAFDSLTTAVIDVLNAEIASANSGFALIPDVTNVPQGKYQDASNLVFANKNEIADRSLAQIAIFNEDFVFPTDPASDVENYRYYDAYRLIQNNKGVIVDDTWNNTATYITTEGLPIVPSAVESKCRRDIGYFVDALSLDIFTRGNRYTREFTLQYFDEYGIGSNEVTGDQKQASLFAFGFATGEMKKAVRNGGSLYVDNTVVEGPAVFGSGDPIVTRTDLTACSDVQLNLDNLNTIVTEVITDEDVDLLPYLNNGSYQAGAGKCKRDIGYLIDAIVEDLYNERNINSKAFAQAYFPGGVFAGIETGDDLNATIAAFNKAISQMELAVTNNLFKQDLTIIPDDGLDPKNPANCADVRATINSLVNIPISAFQAEAALPGSGQADIDSVIDDYGLIPPQETKCGRDIGFFVDAISLDIFLGAGNTYARKLAQAYFITPDVPIYPGLVGEESESVIAFNKARDMMQKAVTNQLFVKDLTLTPGPATFGEKIVALDRLSGVATVTTSVEHELETGDVVGITDTGTTFDFVGATVTVISTTEFTYTDGQTLEPDENLTGTDLGTVVRPNFESGNEDACVDVQSSIASLTSIVTDVITAGNLSSLPKETKFREDRYDDAAYLIGINKYEIQDRALAQVAIDYPDFVYRGDDASTENMRFFDSYRLIQQNKTAIIDDAFATAEANILFTGFDFAAVETKCKRDLGYFVDAISLDVFSQTNRYIRLFTGFYFDESGAPITLDTTESVYTFRAASEIMKAVITNQDSLDILTGITSGAIANTVDMSAYTKDLTLTPDPITLSNIDPLSCADVRTTIDNLTTVAKDSLESGSLTTLPPLNEGIFLDTDSVLTPGGKKCRRDIGFIIDAVMADLKQRSNTNIIKAANAYLEGGVLIPAIAAEKDETIAAFTEAISAMQVALTNNAFKQDLTITPDPLYDPDPKNPAACADVQAEVDSLVNIVIGTLQSEDDTVISSTTVQAGSPGENEVKCRRDIGYVTRAIAEDVYANSNINTITVARAYFDKNGDALAEGIVGEEAESITAYKAAAKYAKKALTNQLFSKDLELFRGPEEYGLSFANRDYTKSGSDKVCVDVQHTVDSLITIIEKVISDGNLSWLATVKENKGLASWRKTESLCYRDTGYVVVGIATDLKVGGNVNTTDIANFYFDNETGELIYIDGELEQSILAYRTARDIMKKAANQWIVSPSNDLYEPKYSLQPLYTDPEVIIDFDYPYCQDVLASIDNYWNIIEDMLVYDGPFSVPAQLPSFKTTVFVKSGVYTEQTPITLPPNTGIFGDNLRDVSIYPSNPTENLIYCENGGYITNVTFSGHLFPSYTCSFPKVKIGDNNQTYVAESEGIITRTGSGIKGSYKITLDDLPGKPGTATQGLRERMYVTVADIPEGSLTGGVATAAVITSIDDNVITLTTANELTFNNISLNFDYYIGTAGNITRSPYVQNCTSLTTTGSGLIVDGNLAEGTASFVLDSYTQYNQGGDGITIVNGGYTQLVSIFEICCNRAVYLTAGSTCSITNSNTDFGNFGLVADGVSSLQYTATVDGTQGPGAEFQLKNLPREPYVGQGITIGNNGQPYYFIQEINITNGGSGYSSPPSVVIDDPTGPSGIPAQAIANVTNGVVTSITLVSSGSQFIDPPNITLVGGTPTVTATVEPEMYPQYYSILTSTDVVDGKATITTDENIAFDLNDGDEVYFFQLTRIIANSHCMEYVGAGTKIQEAIPARGGVPIQEREVVELNGGKVAFTSTDHLGNFRIGQGLQINQNTGTLSGDSFQRSLFVTVTPFILALS